MLVYAYTQGGVTESGIVATAVLIPAAALAPIVAALGRRIALGTSLVVAYAAQAVTNGGVAVACSRAHRRLSGQRASWPTPGWRSWRRWRPQR
jgi:hypothetical protein